MCGRYVPPREADMERVWHIGRRSPNPFDQIRYNVTPSSQVPILIRLDDGAVELLYVRWGLIPAWWKKQSLPPLTFNARSEEAAGKPMWRKSLTSSRCLMPALGWYEWNEGEQVRAVTGKVTNQPYFHYSPNSDLIAFAGLWSVWEPPGAAAVLSCALLSKEAAPDIANIHHRMPVVVHPDDYNAWLDPGTPMDAVQAIIADSRQDVVGYRVSTQVNDVRNDFPELIEQLKEDATTYVPRRNDNFDMFH
jgi:putative SOS response-associated peptidase YedK